MPYKLEETKPQCRYFKFHQKYGWYCELYPADGYPRNCKYCKEFIEKEDDNWNG